MKLFLKKLNEITKQILQKKYADAEFAFLADSFIRGKQRKVIELTEKILQPHGGFLFEGVKLDAPKDWRKSL